MFNLNHVAMLKQNLHIHKILLFLALASGMLCACLASLSQPTYAAEQLEASTTVEQLDFSLTEQLELSTSTEYTEPQYLTGEVEKIISQQTFPGDPQLYAQTVLVSLPDGTVVEVQAGNEFQPLSHSQLLSEGTQVIVVKQATNQGVAYAIADVNRLPVVAMLVALFIVIVIVIARWQGLFSIIGMGLSLIILLQFTIPTILNGNNPFLISILSAVMIACLTLYVAHGWSMKSHIALLSILIVLGLVALLSYTAVTASYLVGLGSEEAFFLQYGETGVIDLQGLLLGGILLGALGVLDDIAVAQAGIVFQLTGANKKLGLKELFTRGMVIGRDHIASLVNTLFLAYVGANTALFLLFYLNEQTPFWVAVNSQQIVEEVIRTIAGSIGLVLAVPLTTMLAALAVTRYRKICAKDISKAEDVHRH